jgi:hypothetical protein
LDLSTGGILGGHGEYLTFYNDNLNNPHHRILRPIADIFINSKTNITNNSNIMVHSKSNTTTGAGLQRKAPNVVMKNLKENESLGNTRQVVITTGKRDHSLEIYDETNESIGL